ncbi:MAG TPA: phosphate ABC transporter substrate-binding protein PstS [Solirubrobacter sp.]|nr:phosphate ABC transporter substrate-binding protein PstS [Solirubrobacter sp.]
MKARGLIAACAALAVAGCGGGAAATAPQLNGAGATFPQPVYQEWAARFQEQTGTTVNYQGIGSGGGIAQFTAGTVDFGATDSAMSDEEIAAARAKGEPVHIPTVLGAVTLSYNLEGVDSGMKLDGATIADIFLGRITSWDDPRIAAGVSLPITVCRRSDESGTTKNFTEFLAHYSKAWADGPGVDKSVKWPTGTGAKGNDGVAACIQQNPGSIGYVEQAYALANDFTFASVKNQAGDYIEPTLASTSAAGADLDIPDDLRISTIDAPGADAYPITALTFLLAYQDVCKAGRDAESAKRLKAWLQYAEGDGQNVAGELQYAKLPDALHRRAVEKVDGLRCNGQPIGGT